MGILQSSALTLVVGALGALISLYLTYLFNRYTKRTEEYRKKREDQEAAALKKRARRCSYAPDPTDRASLYYRQDQRTRILHSRRAATLSIYVRCL